MNNHNKEKIKDLILDTLFPKFCLGCQREGTYLCQDCRHLLEISEYDYCLCDKKPLRLPPAQPGEKQNGKCRNCQDKKLSGLFFALSYKDKPLARRLIQNFKYKPFTKDLAKTLASILIEHFILTKNNTNAIWENSILIPVPLDKKKQKQRGYNQSEELALKLSKILMVPVISDSLVKIKATLSQIELSKEERIKNLENAFIIENSKQILGKKIFLVDDVYTTGSTMQECARVLKRANAKSVWGITIAREE